jgi:hypothetical protein
VYLSRIDSGGGGWAIFPRHLHSTVSFIISELLRRAVGVGPGGALSRGFDRPNADIRWSACRKPDRLRAMHKLRHIVVGVLLTLAAISALVAVPSFDDLHSANAAPIVDARHCMCLHGCSGDMGLCTSSASCAVSCGGGILSADLLSNASLLGGRQMMAMGAIAAYEGINQSPPLQPPRQ